jgi:hypothetical protein
VSQVPFKQVPNQIRVPLFYAEVDNSQANSAGINQRALLIGQITTAGAAVPNVPILLQSASDATTQCGTGSVLELMAKKYREGDTFGADHHDGSYGSSCDDQRNGGLARYGSGGRCGGHFDCSQCRPYR